MEKLYEADPFLTRFSAVVESCAQGKKGWDVVLDQTAFYPEGGGQPYDRGVLGGVKVLEVLPGWKCPITGIRRYEDLPENARRYVEFAQKHLGVPITMVSNGPSREDIIYRNSK